MSFADLHSQAEDYTRDVVPLEQRRGAFTMFMLWITMTVGFPTVLAGFDWYRRGFTMWQVLIGTIISSLILLSYTAVACYLGTVSGQSYALLLRRGLGGFGYKIVAIVVTCSFLLWYALTAVLLAQAVNGTFHTPMPTIWMAVLFTMLMSVNNFFGFSGVVNFARYLVAPVLIAWVGCAFFKGIWQSPSQIWLAPAHRSLNEVITVTSSFLVGFSVWGNEPDFWRWGKPKPFFSVPPLLVTYAVALIMFPLAGFMVANIYKVTDFGSATAVMNTYVFGNLPILAILALSLNYFASNDSNLYGSVTAAESMVPIRRNLMVCLLTLVAVLAAMWLTNCPNAFESMTILNSFLVSTPTVIMCTEFLLVSRITKIKHDFSYVVPPQAISFFKSPALISLTAGYTAGILTSGLIPTLSLPKVGVCAIYAWLVAAVVYVGLRLYQEKILASRQSRAAESL